MSLKDWKNNELRTVLSERWGFSFNLLNEGKEEELEEGGAANRMGDPRVRRQDPDRLREEEEVFAPNHYCVHHGGVERNGSVEMAEAVAHNFNKNLGRVTHYDMKFADGTIMENVAFEDIQVTSASLAEMHGSHPAKSDPKDKRDEELDEAKGEKGDADPLGGERAKFDKDHDGVPDGADKDPDDPKVGSKKKMNEQQIRRIIRKLVKEAVAKKAK